MKAGGSEPPQPPPPLYLAGPTASGKSAVALLLAGQLRGEIISVDSMQAYRGMDIGTAKPNAAERRRIPHHLIDVTELSEPFDAARFVGLAKKAESEIQARGGTPIYCGGTGLYFKGLLEGLGEAPPADPILRAALESLPLAQLLDELARTDPATYERIDRQNPRRVVRALEVIRLTGRPFSAQRSAWSPGGNSPSTPNQPGIFGLKRTASDLHARIDRRVDEMFAAGLVAEVERLLGQGLRDNPTAMQAIGYRQVVEYLEHLRSLPDTITLVKQKTRQFAKRQMTWFRRQLAMEWVEIGTEETAGEIAARILAIRGKTA